MGICYHPRIIVPSQIVPSSVFPVQVTMGDSTTFGNDIPAQAWRVALSSLAGKTGHNASANGRTIGQMVSAYGTEVIPFAPTATAVPAVTTLLIGNNSFFTETAAQAFAELTPLIQNSRNFGFYVVLMTVTPASSQGPGSNWDNVRLAYNLMLQEAWYSGQVDFCFDLAALLPDPTNQTFYESDGTHYNAAGNTLIANTLFPALKTQFNWT